MVKKIITGPGVYICDECVVLCVEIMAEDNSQPAKLIQPEGAIDDALDRMVALHRSREQVDKEVATAVRALRGRGVTWTKLGAALGISRQSAWERYSGEE
jgi:ATP-dependent Clp protease ATP-binding subunit ClpX